MLNQASAYFFFHFWIALVKNSNKNIEISNLHQTLGQKTLPVINTFYCFSCGSKLNFSLHTFFA